MAADHLGTPILATDKQGNKSWRGHSEAFGSTGVDGGGPIQMNLRFPGQYYDRETGLHQNWFRDYNPGVGRYAQEDPIGFWGGVNRYAYGNSNAILYIDPYGLWAFGDPIDQRVVNFVAAWGDTLSFNMTRRIREGYGWGAGAVDYCDGSYKKGANFGNLHGMALGFGGGAQAIFRGVRGSVTISRWGRPGLHPGDWVMVGKKTRWSYVNTFKWDPSPTNIFARYSSGESYLKVLTADIRYPPGFWRGLLFGQRIYSPGATGLPAWIYDAVKYGTYGTAQALRNVDCGC